MTNRREFLSSSLLAAAALSQISDIRGAAVPVGLSPVDDEGWAILRNLFPLTYEKTYLNNGTMGITPYPVLKAVQESFESIAKNGTYPPDKDDLKNAIAKVIGCIGGEIAITKNVSEAINIGAWGVPLKKGDEVLLTTHEHVGGCFPWLHRAKRDGIVLKTFELGKTAELTLENVRRAITKKTKAIAVPHIPCTIGQILPVKEICALANEKGIWSLVDGAHPFGMLQFNVKEIGCDVYSSCAHKWMLGPIGVGFLYVNQSKLNLVETLFVGGGSAPSFNMTVMPPEMGELTNSAHRYHYGTFAAPLYDGALAAIELYHKIGAESIEKRIKYLGKKLQDGLLELGSAIEMLTPVEDISRGAQIGFRIKGIKSDEFVSEMGKKKIQLRHVHEGKLDSIRVSTHYYNSPDEIKQLIEEVKNTLK